PAQQRPFDLFHDLRSRLFGIVLRRERAELVVIQIGTPVRAGSRSLVRTSVLTWVCRAR
ncbi:hypothetical protein L210DRAFT_3592435, partial [Boletus edulis BED1]